MAKNNFIVRGGLDMSNFQKGMTQTQKNLVSFQKNVGKTMKLVATTIGSIAIGSLVKDSVDAASNLESAMMGLESIIKGQGRSFGKAKLFIDNYVADGLIPLTDAVTAYKNLVARGYDDKQIQNTLLRLKDAAAFGRQSSYTLGEAVMTATEGLKNENSILVDNAGVTKNVAKMWEDYAKSIGKSAVNLTQQEKIQAEVNGIMQETRWQVGDAAKYTQTYSGQMAALNKTILDIKVNLGKAVIPISQLILPAIQSLSNKLASATAYAAAFIQALTGKKAASSTSNLNNQTDTITEYGDAVEAAGEKVNNATLPIDELNKITSGSSSGSIMPPIVDTSDTNEVNEFMGDVGTSIDDISQKAQEMADKVRPKIQAMIDWFDKIKPALIGIAAAFATYEIITLFSNLAIKIGAFNPAIGIAALAVGAFIGIGEALKKLHDDAVEADLEKRFGDIVLSLEEVQKIADKLTTTKYTANIDIFVNENTKLSELQTNIETDLATLNKLNWKIDIGIGLTPEETETYKKTIDQFISDTNAYIEQQQYVVTLAIDAVVQSDNKFNDEITTLVDEYFKSSKGEMQRLGEQLRAEMDNALADGKIDEKEQQVIGNLIAEMNEITSQVSNAEFQAKLQMITVDGDISADSFKDLVAKVQSAIDEKLSGEQEAYFTALTYVNMAYKTKLEDANTAQEKADLQTQWDADVKQLAGEFSQTKATITLEGMSFSLDVLSKNYSDGLEGIRPTIEADTKELMTEASLDIIKSLSPTEAVSGFVGVLFEDYQTAMVNSGLSNVSRNGLAEMLTALAPTEEQYQKIYTDALAAGTKIPDGVSAALTDMANLGMLTGDLDSIYFLIGQKLSTDQTFLDMLAKSNDAGKYLDDNLIAGLKSKIPDLRLQGENLVFNISDAISNATAKDTNAKSAVETWLEGVSTTVRNWKLPTLKVGIEIDDSTLQAYTGKYNLNVSAGAYASGGLPPTGELFVANEAGPELVGKIGSQTAVANSDQITDAIASGIYAPVFNAVASAMSKYNGGSTLNIDSEKFTTATKKGGNRNDKRQNLSLDYV